MGVVDISLVVFLGFVAVFGLGAFLYFAYKK